MLHLQIDPQSGIPVYRQIMDQVKYYVASGALKPGDGLPSIRDLAKTLRVNPTTIVNAYKELAHDETIEILHGKGAFISKSVKKLSEEELRASLRRLVRQLVVEANQMGASPQLVFKVLKEELNGMSQGGNK